MSTSARAMYFSLLAFIILLHVELFTDGAICKMLFRRDGPSGSLVPEPVQQVVLVEES